MLSAQFYGALLGRKRAYVALREKEMPALCRALEMLPQAIVKAMSGVETIENGRFRAIRPDSWP